MRDLRNDRVRSAGVREERLRATAGLRSSPSLSSWRGHSGRRYIVGVHPFSGSDFPDVAGAVVLAVRRDGAGVAHVVDATIAGSEPGEEAWTRWTAQAQEHGASELHIHRLAETDAQRRAILEDLRDDGGQASYVS